MQREHQREVIKVANEILERAKRKANIRSWCEDLRTARIKMLGHILRADEDDPMRSCFLTAGTIKERSDTTWRVGRPRVHWLHQTMAEAWESISGQEASQYEGLAYQDEIILGAALARVAPFEANQ